MSFLHDLIHEKEEKEERKFLMRTYGSQQNLMKAGEKIRETVLELQRTDNESSGSSDEKITMGE